MKPVWRSASIANQVKSQFTISAFHTIIYLTGRHVNFAHNDFEMPDQRFHLIIDIFLGRQVILWNISMIDLCFSAFEFLHFFESLFQDSKRLPHLLVANKETIITVPGRTYGNIKFKIFIAAVRSLYPYIVVNTSCPQVRPGKAIIHRPFCTDRTNTNCAFHENPVSCKEFFKLFQNRWVFIQEFLEFLKCDIIKISFESANAADISSEP